MKKPKAPKNGGTLATQKTYTKKLADYAAWKKLREQNADKARRI